MDPYSSGQFNQFQQMPPMQTPRTNGKAIGALVLGIISLISPFIGFILGIIAIVLASLAFKEINMRNDGGRGMAVAGLVCGIIGTTFEAIIILLYIIGLMVQDSYYDALSIIPHLNIG
ncbi:DUF4190 domain-containing protein [Paenibacillus sp.]|uniref:DUF4190 domain-containing protein n=1 Tax=Paenibacillus sp. TaxID=58172 RepID=UPI00282AA711|nr:DUF4190 domain-containing protein [Paenibacillus sp.]MDR0267504.1 DUF4190 domain-containing protein [Paenibacillus sp.]